MSKEKDYYFNLLEQKNDELTKVKTEREKLATLMDEKDRNLVSLKQQSDNISQLVEVNSRTSDNIREEKERIIYLLNEKTASLEELRTGAEYMGKKLRLREKRVRELEEERMKLTEELSLKVQDMEATYQEKESLFKELKESRMEVANGGQNNELLKKELAKHKAVHERDVGKLQSKLKGYEHDLKLAQKVLRSKDSVDNKAVRYADKVQKEITNKRGEVDSLQSRMRRLEDKLESVAKQKYLQERDNDSLKKSLTQSMFATEQLSEELEGSSTKNQELRHYIAQLQTALEKAETKASISKTQLVQFEQDMTKMKLKYQLDVKEATLVSSGNRNIYSNMSSLPPKVASSVDKSESRNIFAPKQMIGSSTVNPALVPGKFVNQEVQREVPKDANTNYNEVGNELKALLTEMRSLVAGQKETTSSSRRTVHHSSPYRSAASRRKDSSPDQDSMSDSEIEPTWMRSRGRSNMDFSGISSVREVSSAPQTPHRKHQRCHSAELFSSGGRRRGDSPNVYISNAHSRSSYLESPHRSRVSLSSLTPDTQEICKRLEEKIENLTRMGGTLQRENREVANLMTVHGRKIDTIRENERKMHKSPR